MDVELHFGNRCLDQPFPLFKAELIEITGYLGATIFGHRGPPRAYHYVSDAVWKWPGTSAVSTDYPASIPRSHGMLCSPHHMWGPGNMWRRMWSPGVSKSYARRVMASCSVTLTRPRGPLRESASPVSINSWPLARSAHRCRPCRPDSIALARSCTSNCRSTAAASPCSRSSSR